MDARTMLELIKTKHEDAKSAMQGFLCHFYSDESGVTLLHYSAEFGNAEITRYLLESGCDINAQDIRGETPLIVAVIKNHEAVIKILLTAGADIHIRNKDNKSALHMVFARQKVSTDVLISFFNVVKKQFLTSEDIGKSLIDSGCHLYQAIFLKDLVVIKYMLLHGSPVESRRPSDYKTALHLAVSFLDVETVKLLLEYGADANPLDDNVNTPLYSLYLRSSKSTRRKLEILQLLLSSGVSSTEPAPCGDFQISSALRKGNRDAIRIILQTNFDFTAKETFTGRNLLYYLAKNAKPGVVEELKKYGDKLDVRAIDNFGWSPLLEAVKKSNVQMVKFLLEEGADANIVCRHSGLTPIYIAYIHSKQCLRKEHDQIFELLLQHKADPQLDVGSTEDPTTIFHLRAKKNHVNRMKAAIAHMALLEEFGASVTELSLSQINALRSQKKYFNRCRRVLRRKITNSLTVLELLTDRREKFARYMDNEFIRKLDRLRIKNKLKLIYPYYYNTVEKLFLKGREYKQASLAISRIFHDCIDENHLITHAIMNYLNNQSLQALSQYSQVYR